MPIEKRVLTFPPPQTDPAREIGHWVNREIKYKLAHGGKENPQVVNVFGAVVHFQKVSEFG